MTDADSVRQVRLKFRCEGEIRLVILPLGGKPDYTSLQKSLSADYGFDVALKYTDSDGDLITLASQNDLENLLVCATSSINHCVDVFVSESLQLPEIKRSTASNSGSRCTYAPNTPSPSISNFSKIPVIPPLFPTVSGNSLDTYRTAASKESPIKWKRGEVIGQGAFGVVYLGLNTESGELLAVKQMALEEVSVKELSQLENEINLLRSLRHPNIVRYIGTEVTPTSLSIFLEYIPGGSLKNLIEKFGNLEENVVRSYTRQLLLGLEYLHRNGIAHRDIKGANCLVGNDGVVKLADFGASKHWRTGSVPAASASHKSGDIKGTPSWMAPELVQDNGPPISWRKADVWSLACTTLEMTTGVPPWSQFNNHVTILYHLACTDVLPEYPSDASIELVTFLNMCLHREPARRPDITSLLLHPFVSGAGWSSSIARPSTVSTTPAWAWTAREIPMLQRVPLVSSRLDILPLATTRIDPLQARNELVSIRGTEQLQPLGDHINTGGSKKKSNLSPDTLAFPFTQDNNENDVSKHDHSDSESTASSAVSKRRLRSKGKIGKSGKSDERRRKSSDKTFDDASQGRSLPAVTVMMLEMEPMDAVFEESKESSDWVKEPSEEEILEEIEESFDDSLELVELSTSAETFDDHPAAIETNDCVLSGVAEADLKQIKLENDSKSEAKSSIQPRTKSKPSTITKVSNLAAPTLRERRQWTGSIDVAKANAGGNFDGRDFISPLTDLGNPYAFKMPSQPSSKSTQRGATFASTPSTFQDKGKRGGKLRASAELESTMYGFSAEETIEEQKDEAEKCCVNFTAIDGSNVHVLSEHQGQVTRLFVSRRSQILISSSVDGTVRLWNSSSNDCRCVLDTSLFNPSAGAPDLASAETPKRSKCHDEKYSSFPSTSIVKVNHLWADDSCETVWGGCSDFYFRVWNGVEGKPLRLLKGHDDLITCVDGSTGNIIQSNTMLASGSADRTVRLFDVRSKKPQIFVFRGHTDSVLTLKMAEGGRTIISGSKDKSIKLFDTRTGRLRLSLEKHFGAVNNIRLVSDLLLAGKSSDTQGFVTGGRDSMLNVWNFNGDHLTSQVAHRGSMNRITYISDGVFATTGSDSVVKIWDARRIKPLSEIKTGAVAEILYNQNSFITASASGLLKVWSPSVETKQSVDLFQQSSPCTDIVAGNDFIASSSKSGQILRWTG